MTHPAKLGAGQDRAIGPAGRSMPGDAAARPWKREAGAGDKGAGDSRSQARQSAAAASFPLDYRFSVL